MKKIPGLIFVAIMLLLGCSKQADIARTEHLLEETRQQFCPDKRVCIWEISFSPGKPIILKGSTNLPAAKTALLEELNEAGIDFADSIRILPSYLLEGRHFGLTSVSVSNIRSQAKHSAELATQAPMGTPLLVYEQQGEWFRVQTPDQYLGWLDEGAFVLLDSIAMARWRQNRRLIIQPELSVVWSQPDLQSPSVSDLVSGCLLEQTGEKDGFFKVSLPDGRQGYVQKAHAQAFDGWKESLRPQPEGILGTAFSLMGRPYLWGGTSVKGMDCSGFTKTVFFQNGMLLPRDASQQVQIGEKVETDSTFSQLLPGDLLFFGRRSTQDLPEKITHVAIYVEEGKFIHASSQVKVESLFQDDSLYSDYRRSTFVKAKRILSTEAVNEYSVDNHLLY